MCAPKNLVTQTRNAEKPLKELKEMVQVFVIQNILFLDHVLTELSFVIFLFQQLLLLIVRAQHKQKTEDFRLILRLLSGVKA